MCPYLLQNPCNTGYPHIGKWPLKWTRTLTLCGMLDVWDTAYKKKTMVFIIRCIPFSIWWMYPTMSHCSHYKAKDNHQYYNTLLLYTNPMSIHCICPTINGAGWLFAVYFRVPILRRDINGKVIVLWYLFLCIYINSRVHTVVHCSRNYFSRKCKCQSACPHDKYRNKKTRVFINWWRQLRNEYRKYRVTSCCALNENRKWM